jgi:hypothetical protein
MGEMLSFDSLPRLRANVARASSEPAKILLFTGVRYERMAEPAPLQAATGESSGGPAGGGVDGAGGGKRRRRG